MKGKSIKYVPGIGPAVPGTCQETGAGFLMGGPIWLEPLHDPAWVRGLLEYIEVRLCHGVSSPDALHLSFK